MDFYTSCRNAVAEGTVLLENDGALPLNHADKVALFGRGQIEYYKGGTGSGGRINCEYVSDILTGLKKEVVLDEELVKFYEDYIKNNPFTLESEWVYCENKRQEPLFSREEIKKYAKRNDKAIFVIGRQAGEGYDCRAIKGDYYLSEREETTIKYLTEFFDKVIVLINSGSIIDASWIKKYSVGTVAYIWQGGQEGGNGTVDMLIGKNPPSGRLADTIAPISDNPSYGCFGDETENVHKEDIYVGYRYFETFKPSSVIYPFGYGLGYTKFTYETLDIYKKNDEISIKVKIKNVGNYTGKEVIQIYYSTPSDKIKTPVKQLISYKKTKLLEPQEEQILEFYINVENMSVYDEFGESGHRACFVLEKGEYGVFVGENVRAAKEAFSFKIEKTVCVKKCSNVLSPEKPIIVITERDGKEEEVVRSYSIGSAARRKRETIEYTGDKDITFGAVKNGEHSLDEFIAQFTAKELSSLVKGEGMSSVKAPIPGTAGCFGGVTEFFNKKGVPIITACDGPQGLRLECGVKATCIPIGTLVACSFNPQAFSEVFAGVAAEMKKYGVNVLLGPGINIHRNPLCGRNFEYYSEDPFLAGTIAAKISEFFTDNGVLCTLKHFAVNSQETNRAAENEVLTERALREIYLKPFEIAIKSGKVYCIMTAYNRINGVSCAANYGLTAGILRDEWGYDGMVMTDWWTMMDDGESSTFSSENLAAMVKAQNDIYMVVNDAVTYSDDLKVSIDNGYLSLYELQTVAKHILSTALFFDFSTANNSIFDSNKFTDKTIFETCDVSNFNVSGVREGLYVAEAEYSVNGDELAQYTLKIFVDSADAVIVIVNGTRGKTKKVRFNLYLKENSNVRVEQNFVSKIRIKK